MDILAASQFDLEVGVDDPWLEKKGVLDVKKTNSNMYGVFIPDCEGSPSESELGSSVIAFGQLCECLILR